MKTYSKLEEKFEYDKEAATELAEAMTDKPQELTMANSPQLDKLKERDDE